MFNGNMYTRVRNRSFDYEFGKSELFYNNQLSRREYYRGRTKETTSDRENMWYTWLSVNKIAPWTRAWDVGGPFESVKTRVVQNGVNVNLRYFPYQGDYLYRFRGLLLPGIVMDPYEYRTGTTSLWNPISYSSYSDLDQFGSEAIAATRPDSPHFDMYQALEELRREGLPKVPGLTILRDRSLKGAAGEHLNYEFGINPLVRNVQDLADVIRRADELLAQYQRDSGRLIRRKLDVPEESSFTESVHSTQLYPRNTVAGFFSSKGPTLVTVETRRRLWFSAAYRYFITDANLPYIGDELDKLEKLLGVTPTPEKLYSLAPWTWMLDWFTNSGEMLSAIASFTSDPMLIRWAYVMEHMMRTTTYSQTLITNEGQSVTTAISLIQERKLRRKATPFGFGLTEEDLTSRQKAILAAIGISKMPFG